VFVVKAADTRKSNIRDALRRLRTGGLAPLGVALTRAPANNASYYSYASYYGYGYGKPDAAATFKPSQLAPEGSGPR